MGFGRLLDPDRWALKTSKPSSSVVDFQRRGPRLIYKDSSVYRRRKLETRTVSACMSGALSLFFKKNLWSEILKNFASF